MALLKALCWALIFILRIRFPPDTFLATVLLRTPPKQCHLNNDLAIFLFLRIKNGLYNNNIVRAANEMFCGQSSTCVSILVLRNIIICNTWIKVINISDNSRSYHLKISFFVLILKYDRAIERASSYMYSACFTTKTVPALSRIKSKHNPAILRFI